MFDLNSTKDASTKSSQAEGAKPAQNKTAKTAQTEDGQSSQTEGAKLLSFDEWIAEQDEPIKALVSDRFKALENTVRATREERNDLKKQLDELSKKQAEGSELRKSLDEISAKLDSAEKRAAFLEEAIKPEIQCKNAKAAWVLAEAQDLFDRQGRPDWARIKAEAPELFGAPTTHANAGEGTGQAPPSSKSMNDFIRAAAGRL